MNSPCIKLTVCKVLSKSHRGKYLVAYVLNTFPDNIRLHFRHVTLSDHIHPVTVENLRVKYEQCHAFLKLHNF